MCCLGGRARALDGRRALTLAMLASPSLLSPSTQAFRYIDDIKAGVPRTAYKGIVSLKHNGCRKFIVPTATLDANNALPH